MVERDEGRFAGNISRGKGRTNRNSVGGKRCRLVSVRRQKHTKIAGFRVVIPPRTPWNLALEKF